MLFKTLETKTKCIVGTWTVPKQVLQRIVVFMLILMLSKSVIVHICYKLTFICIFFPNFFLNNKFTVAGLKRDHGKFKTGVCFFVLRSLHHYVRNIHQWVWQTITRIYTTVSICVNGNRWLRIFWNFSWKVLRV